MRHNSFVTIPFDLEISVVHREGLRKQIRQGFFLFSLGYDRIIHIPCQNGVKWVP
jgi:hypothetical protein